MYLTPMALAIVAAVCTLAFAVLLTALLQEQAANKARREEVRQAELARLGQINAAASILGAAIHRVFYSEQRNEKDLQEFLLNGLPARLNTLAKVLNDSIKEAADE